ncbi:MAG: GNAT family N-acetyltransferase [Clostridiales bacterium]|nr:GNAT family N-acetyltransferase [Clostridiales bacterium]
MGEKRSFWHFLTLPAAEPATPQEYFARLPVIDTPRLILRKMRMSDAPDVYRYAKDPEVARHVLWEAHQSVWETRAYIRYLLWQYRSGLPGSWAIELKETGRVVGTIGYMSYNADNATVEVGYSLAREQWGKGLMTEALTAVIAETFRALDMHRIEAMHFTDNPASGRVMEKCGMTHEGHLRERVCCKGTFRDVEMWGMLRKDWEKHRRKMGPA